MYVHVGPSHYLVHFKDDDSIASVPKKLLLKPSAPSVGDACVVRWSDGVEYDATVVAMGKAITHTVHPTCTCSQYAIDISIVYTTGDAATIRKAERVASQNVGKENREPSPKKRKTSTPKKTTSKKTPSCRKPRQTAKPVRAQPPPPDFELGSPAPGLPPSPTVPLRKKELTSSCPTVSIPSSESLAQMSPPQSPARQPPAPISPTQEEYVEHLASGMSDFVTYRVRNLNFQRR